MSTSPTYSGSTHEEVNVVPSTMSITILEHYIENLYKTVYICDTVITDKKKQR